MTSLGVLADTHIPDRSAALDGRILERFKGAGVSAILHAGDVSVPKVLAELEAIAPVHAVRGNRDIFALHSLPLQVRLTVEGVSIGMAHGHENYGRYVIDKLHREIHGRLAGRYLQRMLKAFPDAGVIVFGHLHVPCNFHLDGKLLFNPGSTSYPWPRDQPPSFGLLHLEQDGEPWGEIIELK